MKALISLLAIVMLFKPIWPVVDFAINYDYIVEYLCINRDKPASQCNGKCYLAKQVAEEEDQDKEKPANGKSYSFDFSIVYAYPSQKTSPPLFNYLVYEYASYTELYSSLFVSEILHPPQRHIYFNARHPNGQ